MSPTCPTWRQLGSAPADSSVSQMCTGLFTVKCCSPTTSPESPKTNNWGHFAAFLLASFCQPLLRNQLLPKNVMQAGHDSYSQRVKPLITQESHHPLSNGVAIWHVVGRTATDMLELLLENHVRTEIMALHEGCRSQRRKYQVH